MNNDFIYIDIAQTNSFIIISKDNEILLKEYEYLSMENIIELVIAFARTLNIKNIYVDPSGFGICILDKLKLLNNDNSLNVHKTNPNDLRKEVRYIEKLVSAGVQL